MFQIAFLHRSVAVAVLPVILLGFGIISKGDAEQPIHPARPEGIRVNLTSGQLFIPAGIQSVDGKVELIVQLHGSAAVAERNLLRSNCKAVLVSVMLNGLSSVYTKQFSDRKVWSLMLTETLHELVRVKISHQPAFSRVTVISFSAGFGGVRELLKEDLAFERIDALIMADSIYAGYVPGSDPPQVEPQHMTGFLKFAREAVAGRKTCVISHCELRPEGYASTAETANYLLHELHLPRETLEKVWDSSWKQRTQCVKNRLQVYGFTGETGADHMQHLHNSWRLLQLSQ